MRNGIDGLMQSGLEQWLAGQADMREGAKKQAASRWTWGAAIALPVQRACSTCECKQGNRYGTRLQRLP